ncbi:MAG TPA: hypothetical protein VFJ94_12455 [Intrasporangium sp.]|uniref:hypothetical protein n=1 Tax=Intrasporangium sp. TaxID=1925024 RepID=UPI002D78165A|nr:hypothetical protein [Intrasporangium sp.]HET7399321.1 hypothetical protein [Intrasporangium sp.]
MSRRAPAGGPGRPGRSGWPGRSGRLLLVALLGVVTVLAPSVAWARFTASATASVSAKTLVLGAPSFLQGTSTCPTVLNKTGRVKVTSFGEVQGATRYVLTLTSPKGVTDSATVPGSQTVNLSVSSTVSAGRGTWTVTVVPGVAGWTGPAWTGTFPC